MVFERVGEGDPARTTSDDDHHVIALSVAIHLGSMDSSRITS